MEFCDNDDESPSFKQQREFLNNCTLCSGNVPRRRVNFPATSIAFLSYTPSRITYILLKDFVRACGLFYCTGTCLT